ncbi:MAG: VOC family protein [Chloroflexi bacterium]|nr:MAG: VOC family protein [Chloroflexota bacterium]
MANAVTWFEITGKDGRKLQDFYSGVFGWKIDANNPMNYGMVDNQGEGIGGGISAGDGGRNQVTFYIAVDNPQAYLDKVESQGGKTIIPVTEIPGTVTFAQFADPEGNVVGLLDSTYQPQQQQQQQ